MRAGLKISDDLLSTPIAGVNVSPGTLGDQLGDGVNLLVFLRHFGCIFCRETLSDLRQRCEEDPGFPQPLFFFQGSTSEGRAFLRRHWPEARAISDPSLGLYEAFGIRRGGLVKMFAPGVWSARSRAAEKGHRNGEMSGDIWRMPGLFLTRGSEIVWAHDFRHAGDQPDYALVREIATSGSGASPSRLA